MDHIKIIVASKSEQKIVPVTQAFEKCFAGLLIDVLGVSVSSGINEQPIGHEETRQGAMNRLQHIQTNSQHDYYVSIENGLLPLGNHWYDFGHVVIASKEGDLQEVITQTVQFPTEAVEEAQKRGFRDITVGKILQENYPHINHADPHFSLTNGMYTRKQLLYNALIAGLGQLSI